MLRQSQLVWNHRAIPNHKKPNLQEQKVWIVWLFASVCHAFQNNPYYFMCKYNRQFQYCYAILTYQKGVIILSLSFVKLKKMCWFAKTDAFQVTEHVPFHFSKPLLVIIYDLETNHDCLCLD